LGINIKKISYSISHNQIIWFK